VAPRGGVVQQKLVGKYPMGFGRGASPENPETEGQDVPGEPPRWTRKQIKRGCGGGKGGVVLGLESKILRAAVFYPVRSCDAEGFDVVNVKNQQTTKKKKKTEDVKGCGEREPGSRREICGYV
jgi:hypothetical protein